MQIFKKLSYLIVFFIVNMALSFLLEPARGSSDMMWEGYYKQEELDTIFVGSSLCQGSIDPVIFDKILGTKSYNMGTPSQAIPQTIRAVEVALEDHDIETVIFAMGFSSLKLDVLEEAELTFEKARAKQKGGLAGFKEALSYLFSEDTRNDEKSINYFFPWLYNREEISKEMMLKNIKTKMEKLSGKGTSAVSEDYKGYQEPGEGVFNYDNCWDLNTYRYYEADFTPEMLQSFEELLMICKERNVELIVVNTPHPFFDVVACYEFYERNQMEVETLCEKYGVTYYDFNLAKPEIFETKSEYYRDYEHLNNLGSKAFCESLCNVLIRRENGETLDDKFYSMNEFLEMYSYWLNQWINYYW